MANTAGIRTRSNALLPLSGAHALLSVEDLFQEVTLDGSLTLTTAYPSILKIDPAGANRDVTLDAEPTSEGLYRRIINAADAAENLVVKDDSPATIATINQNEEAEFWCNGTAWKLLCVRTIALS